MKTSPLIVDPVLQSFEMMHHAVLCTGNIYDFQVDQDSDCIFFRSNFLAEKLYLKGYAVLRYCRSSGFSVYNYTELKKDKKDILNEILQQNGILNLLNQGGISPTEVVEMSRSFIKIASRKHKIAFAIIIDYAPHLISANNPSNEEKIVAEAINEIANRPSVQKSGNLLIVYANAATDLPWLVKNLYTVHYTYPLLAEYAKFFSILKARTDEFAETDLSSQECSLLARGLRLSDLKSLFTEYRVKNEKITTEVLNDAKCKVIEQISDHTLTVLDTPLNFDDLAGLEVPKRILRNFSIKLRNQDPSSPRAILLTGPPGTGKSTIAGAFAKDCGFNLVELSDDIKSKWVGESEARLKIGLDVLVGLAPVVLFIDEIDQSVTNRSSASLDGGVSQHYLKTLFKFIAMEEHRGKVVIVACSNTPQLLDPAMINRFINIPILEPTPEQMTSIFPKIQKRISSTVSLNQDDVDLLEACKILYSKGAMPRQFYEILNHATGYFGAELTGKHILYSSDKFRCSSDANSIAYSSLSAISLTPFTDFLPWSDNPSEYPYPWYLNGMIDVTNGEVDLIEQNKRLLDLKSKSRY
jgi:AAA+ superfamily predicted ATPase